MISLTDVRVEIIKKLHDQALEANHQNMDSHMFRRIAQVLDFGGNQRKQLLELLLAASKATTSCTDLEAQIASWSQVLKIEPKLDPWPFKQFDRYELKGLALTSRAKAYSKRVGCRRSDNLESAIADYDAALEIYTQEPAPADWARTQLDRAHAYTLCVCGNRANNLKVARAGYAAARETTNRH